VVDLQAKDEQLERELAELRAEHDKLRDEKVRTEQNLENVRRQIAELEQQAEREYGVADLDRLQEMLDDRRAENEKLVADYREHVRAIREELERIERGLEEPGR
jgi:chromosome segregation ATPase